MESQKVDAFILANRKYFPAEQLPTLRSLLSNADESKWFAIQSMQLKDPTTSLIISLLGGSLGIDRFFIGDTGLGIAKLITCGGCGVWTFVDFILIMGATRDKNLESLYLIL